MTQEQKRIKIAEACGIDVCGSCFNAIDPECCCCGSPIEGHSQYDGHSLVPMGCRCGYDKQPQPRWGGVPDYFNDLNAMHEAVMSLPKSREKGPRKYQDRIRFFFNLKQLVGGSEVDAWTATAARTSIVVSFATKGGANCTPATASNAAITSYAKTVGGTTSTASPVIRSA